jgi:hypothetical protein
LQASVAAQLSRYYKAAAELLALTAEEAALTESDKPKKDFADNVAAATATLAAYTTAAGFPAVDTMEASFYIDIQMALSPALQGWTVESAELMPMIQQTPDKDNAAFSDDNQTVIEAGLLRTVVLQYTITYRRSTFTRLFAVTIVVIMWVLSTYLLVLAVDHIIVRRRDLEPDTVGYAVGMLFALPALRLLLSAPFGR